MSKKVNKNVKNIYALSPMQEGMLFHALMDEHSAAYVEQTRITARGTIDPVLFETTFKIGQQTVQQQGGTFRIE